MADGRGSGVGAAAADARGRPDERHRRRSQGHVGRRAARRHRRSRQPGAHRKSPLGDTDGAGRYSITSLRPGIYTVTFTLPGFSTVKREGIELTSDFTATINADLKVGALEETITVAAKSPIVDVQSITPRTVMTREVLDAIPTGRNIQAVGIMIPGTVARASAAAARCRATSAARATCSSRRSSTAARATRCRRSKACA